MSSSEPTLSGDALELLAGVAVKLAAAGQVREAEQLLASRLDDTLRRAKAGESTSLEQVRIAARAAVTLAEAADVPKWIDYVFDLLATTDTVIEPVVLERIHTVVRSIPRAQVELLQAYVDRVDACTLGPAERFLVQRLRGLEAVARTR